MAKMNPPPALNARLPDRDVDPDLVDRIFEYLIELSPELAQKADRLAELKDAVRGEFAGDKAWISRTSKTDRERRRQELAAEVLSLFNGTNASEVARRLHIGRATVYRVLKQAGGKA